jgi:hypothetical protein
MTVFPEIFWSSHEISFICKQESEGELSEDRFMTPDKNSDRCVKTELAEMCYLFEGMTWDAGAFSSEKGKGGVRTQ